MQPWIDLQQLRQYARADSIAHEANVSVARILERLDALRDEGAKVIAPEAEKRSDHVAPLHADVAWLAVKRVEHVCLHTVVEMMRSDDGERVETIQEAVPTLSPPVFKASIER